MLAIYGIIWFAVFYGGMALLVHRAEQKLKLQQLEAIKKIRRSFIPVVIFLAILLVLTLIYSPHILWMVVPIIGGAAVLFAFIRFKFSKLLPDFFIRWYAIGVILYIVGIVGFGYSLGYQSGFAL